MMANIVKTKPSKTEVLWIVESYLIWRRKCGGAEVRKFLVANFGLAWQLPFVLNRDSLALVPHVFITSRLYYCKGN